MLLGDPGQRIFVELTTDDGLSGIGYTYTIGTGGQAVLSMLREHLLPRLVGPDPRDIEAAWRDLFSATRATTVGPITSLALATVDTALWDLRCLRAGEPLWRLAGGANQSMTYAEAKRRAHLLEPYGVYFFEEPLPADDVQGHRELATSTSIPIAVGESMYSVGQFRDYLARGAASIVQADVARIGGITPWLKVAHLAEAFNVALCPHFLMELHVSLVA